MPSSTPAERQERQLANAERVQELTMRLIEGTAAKAEQALAAPPPETTRNPDHILDFVRLTRALNQSMVTENRIAKGEDAPKTRYRDKPPRNPAIDDPRRHLIVQAVHQATKNHPDRNRRRREIEQTLDQHLIDDPDQTFEAIEILQTVANEVDLPIDPAKLTDEILGMPPRNLRPPEHETG